MKITESTVQMNDEELKTDASTRGKNDDVRGD